MRAVAIAIVLSGLGRAGRPQPPILGGIQKRTRIRAFGHRWWVVPDWFATAANLPSFAEP